MDLPGQLDVRSEGIRLPRAGHVTLMLPERQVNCFLKAPKNRKRLQGSTSFKSSHSKITYWQTSKAVLRCKKVFDQIGLNTKHTLVCFKHP